MPRPAQRVSQIALLDVGDLQMGREPKLMVPSSLKGKNRKARTRKPLPISAGLAARLKHAAAGRGAEQPLLLNMPGGAVGRGSIIDGLRRPRRPQATGRRDDLRPAPHRDHARAVGRYAGQALRGGLRHLGRPDRKNLQSAHCRSRRHATAQGLGGHRRCAAGRQRRPAYGALIMGKRGPLPLESPHWTQLHAAYDLLEKQTDGDAAIVEVGLTEGLVSGRLHARLRTIEGGQAVYRLLSKADLSGSAVRRWRGQTKLVWPNADGVLDPYHFTERLAGVFHIWKPDLKKCFPAADEPSQADPPPPKTSGKNGPTAGV